MKEIQITCNAKGEVNIDDNARANGISIALVDERGVPVAKYHFDSAKIKNVEKICYTANNYKVFFDITPNMIFENVSSNNI